jgi:hypothetical protein
MINKYAVIETTYPDPKESTTTPHETLICFCSNEMEFKRAIQKRYAGIQFHLNRLIETSDEKPDKYLAFIGHEQKIKYLEYCVEEGYIYNTYGYVLKKEWKMINVSSSVILKNHLNNNSRNVPQPRRIRREPIQTMNRYLPLDNLINNMNMYDTSDSEENDGMF